MRVCSDCFEAGYQKVLGLWCDRVKRFKYTQLRFGIRKCAITRHTKHHAHAHRHMDTTEDSIHFLSNSRLLTRLAKCLFACSPPPPKLFIFAFFHGLRFFFSFLSSRTLCAFVLRAIFLNHSFNF